MLKSIFMFIILLLVGMQPVLGDVYQWRDVSGVMHFTDNPNQVPPQYRKNVVGGLVETAAPPTGDDQVKNTVRTPVKYKVWTEKCISCHHVGEGTKGKLQGLAHLTVNNVTRFPASIDEIVQRLRFAAIGRYSDMSRVDVSDEELRLIAQYLLSMNK